MKIAQIVQKVRCLCVYMFTASVAMTLFFHYILHFLKK